jgi:hypothetical protein
MAFRREIPDPTTRGMSVGMPAMLVMNRSP